MASVIKVKPKKNFQWNQDNKFIYVRIPMPSHTSLKKVEIFLSDLILRVTSLEKKATHFLDLAEEVDYLSSENKFLLTDGELHATLKKKQSQKLWEKLLIEEISLADLKERRRNSEARYEKSTKDHEETKKQIKIEYDRKATQEMMKFEEEERKKLQAKKTTAKNEAIREIFSNVNDSTGKIEYEEQKWAEKEKAALKMIEEEEAQEQLRAKQIKKNNRQRKLLEEVNNQMMGSALKAPNPKPTQTPLTSSRSESMFTEQDINQGDKVRQEVGESNYEEIPVRKSNKMEVKFTERKYPGLAARQSYQKEPPMPSQNKSKANAIQGDNQAKNPLWLKDKGDKFVLDKNYISAIEAYNQAIALDPKMLSAYSNRSVCFLKMFNYNGVISDCEQCIALSQRQLNNSASNSQQQEAQKQKALLFLIKIKLRIVMAKAWKGELQSAKQQIQEILSNYCNDGVKTEILEQLNKCREQILKRQQSILLKLKGDEQVKLNNHQNAVKFYNDSLQIDQNEYSASNKVLCLNKQKSFKEAIQTADATVERLNAFNLGSAKGAKTGQAGNKNPYNIILKLYYRKAKALQEQGLLKQAEETVHKGLAIDSTDKDFQQLLKEMSIRKNRVTIKEEKQKAALLIKQQKYNEALQIYTKSLKMIESSEQTQEYLSLMQNQCVCYLKLQDYDSIISTAIRIMNMINNINSKIVEFGNKKTYNISQQEIQKISIRTLMRRANAYLNKNQVYNAKSDLEKALQISPRDESVQRELEKLNERLRV